MVGIRKFVDFQHDVFTQKELVFLYLFVVAFQSMLDSPGYCCIVFLNVLTFKACVQHLARSLALYLQQISVLYLHAIEVGLKMLFEVVVSQLVVGFFALIKSKKALHDFDADGASIEHSEVRTF